MNPTVTKFYEVRPGLDTLRYLFTYGGLTLLARRASRRPQRLFVQIASNIDRHVLSEGLFEKGVIELLEHVFETCRCNGLMLDIGANIGNHTVALAPRFRRVESVEPHPVLFRVLEANVLANKMGHVRCHNVGLAGENTTGTLEESSGNHALSRIRERSKLAPEVFGLTAESFGRSFSVSLLSAQEFVGQFADQLDNAFIKIDVEGMEEEIIASIAPLLAEHKPIVGFEWFTRSQPKLTGLVANVKGYELWGIRMHDLGSNLLWRAIKLLFTGRSYKLERIDPSKLDEVYPLALLIPRQALQASTRL